MAAPSRQGVGPPVDLLLVLGTWCAVSFAAAPVLGRLIGGRRRAAVSSDYESHLRPPARDR